MNAMQNHMRLQALRAMEHEGKPRAGIVRGYDPSHYSAMVEIQPEGVLTGWLPLTSPWVGNQWGFYAPPSLGDNVDVHFQQDGQNAGYVIQKFFNNSVQPLAVPSGEFWIVHKSGSLFKLHNDGSVELTAATTLRLVAADIQLHATNSYRFDVNGHGQHWHGNYIDTWQIGEVAGTAHAISPPEIS